MPLSHIPQLSLDTLDSLPAGDLALFCAVDERPLMAAAGYVDWRLNGWLSQLILRGQFKGQRQERLLTPSAGRIPPSRIFLFGLGQQAQFHHKLAGELGGEFAQSIASAGATQVTVGLPGGGDSDAHGSLLQALQEGLRSVKMTTWGPWSNLYRA